MLEPLSFSSLRLRRIAIGIALGALLCLGVARVPLEGTDPIEALGTSLEARLGTEVRFGRVRMDPLGARGLVLEDVTVAGRGWRLSLPRAVWRPELLSLLTPERRSVLHARRFALSLDPEGFDPAPVGAALSSPGSGERLPSLRLSGGRLSLAGGAPLLEDVSLASSRSAAFEVRGRQRGGGRIDLRGRRTPEGGVEIDLFPESLALGPVEGRLLAAVPELGIPALGAAVGGHWNTRFEPDGVRVHRFGLELHAESPGVRRKAAATPAAPRLRLQVRGRVTTEPQPGSRSARAFAGGSHVVLNGRVRRLSTAAGALPRLHVSGPVSASLALFGPARAPGLHGTLFLDEAHLRVGAAVRKPCGVRARVRLDSEMEGPELGPALRTTRVALDLGALRAALVRRGAGPFEGASDWVPLGDLASWLRAAEERASGGRVRLTSLRLSGPDAFDAELEFEDAAFEGRRSPLPLTALNGLGRLTAAGFSARDIVGALAGVPVHLDVSALRSSGEAAPRMRFAVRADEIDLAGLGVPLGSPADAGTGPLPSVLVAAAEPPMTLLRRRRESLAQLEVAAGRFEVGRLRAGGELLRDVEVDLALSALRLDVSRLSFRQRGRRASFAGSIDLDQLVPIVEFASVP